MNLGYLAAVVVLGGIILFHEFGHYLLARLNGIAVVEFSVGFGPRLLSWVSQKTGIRYSLKLLPLGGSCAMLGEFGEDEDEKEEVPDVKGVSFFDKGPLAKMAVIAAGPLFNFILAFVFSLVILSWAGIDPAVIAGTSEGMPAETAGLKEGDVITKLDGRKIHLSREISMYLMTAGQDPVQVGGRAQNQGLVADKPLEHDKGQSVPLDLQAVDLQIRCLPGECSQFRQGILQMGIKRPVQSRIRSRDLIPMPQFPLKSIKQQNHLLFPADQRGSC